jgi:NADH:ubiquinone oxidoreductase subunit E
MMKACVLSSVPLILALSFSVGATVQAFFVTPILQQSRLILKNSEKVEVCGFKDCKRAGGGKRLENLINAIVEEKGLSDAISVEGCDCQGECGYGPNVVVDGKLINNVRGREAVLQALGLDE